MTGEKQKKCNCVAYAHRIGLFLALLFLVCFFWYFIMSNQRELHLALLQLSFLGFKEMTWVSFVYGLVQSYLWGYVAVFLWWLTGGCPIWKWMIKK